MKKKEHFVRITFDFCGDAEDFKLWLADVGLKQFDAWQETRYKKKVVK